MTCQSPNCNKDTVISIVLYHSAQLVFKYATFVHLILKHNALSYICVSSRLPTILEPSHLRNRFGPHAIRYCLVQWYVAHDYLHSTARRSLFCTEQITRIQLTVDYVSTYFTSHCLVYVIKVPEKFYVCRNLHFWILLSKIPN